MGAKPFERFAEADDAELMQGHGQEAGVHEVQHRVLVATDVAVHRQPLGGQLRLDGEVVAAGGGVAEEVPAAAQKVVGDVGVAMGVLAAGRTGGVEPVLGPRQGALAAVVGAEVLEIGEFHRQFVFRHRHRAAICAMDDGNGRSPVPLPGYAPVMQPEIGLGFGAAFGFEPLDDGLLGVLYRQAVEVAGVHQCAVAWVGLGQRRGGILSGCGDDAHDGQAEGLGEFEVAGVVAGHRHDRAGAVAHEHVVGDPNGDAGPVCGIDRVAAGEHARLFLVGLLPFHEVAACDLGPIGVHRRLRIGSGDGVHQGMLRGQHHVGGPEQGVRPGGEHANAGLLAVRAATGDGKADVRALAAADPGGLRLLGDVRPVHVGQVVEQLAGVVGDAEEPLRQLALLDRGFAAFAQSAGHLLIGQHRHARRAPVDRCLPALHEAGLVELEKHPLGPAVVADVGGVHGVVPVEHAPEALQGAGEVLDVLGNQVIGVAADLQGVVFGMNAEGVKADGLEDVLAVQALKAPVHVGAGVGVDVADVQPFRGRVGEHHQVVVGVLGVRQLRLGQAIDAIALPTLPPLALHGFRRIAILFVGHGRVGGQTNNDTILGVPGGTPNCLRDAPHWSEGVPPSI